MALGELGSFANRAFSPLPTHRFTRLFPVLLILFIISSSNAQQSEQPYGVEFDGELNNCSTKSDEFFGNAQNAFNILEWYRRGICVRHGGSDPKCYTALNRLLDSNLNEIRKAEYAGAAGVMALLPTIGALLGAPTNEIWRLLTMVPFGGVLAMAMSFGGAILPSKVEDYESDFMKRKINIDPSNDTHKAGGRQPSFQLESAPDPMITKVERLLHQVNRRLAARRRTPVPVKYIWTGLIGMLFLLMGAQLSMGLVEQGALLPWWCASRWWIHLWYMMVLLTAAVDNWAQLPFSSQSQVTLSDIPYDVDIEGGDDITSSLTSNSESAPAGIRATKSVGLALKQLPTLKAGTVVMNRHQQRSKCRNTLIVMVSVVEGNRQKWKAFFRACSQLSSIGVFITGTAMFASAQLLPIAMATFVLTLVLAAGVFGRTIAGWIVSGIEQAEPMMHYVAETDEEAHYVIAKLLSFELGPETDVEDGSIDEPRKIQVELKGHIFVSKRRITRRSRWPKRLLGIIAPTYDLMNAVKTPPPDNGERYSTYARSDDKFGQSLPLTSPLPSERG